MTEKDILPDNLSGDEDSPPIPPDQADPGQPSDEETKSGPKPSPGESGIKNLLNQALETMVGILSCKIDPSGLDTGFPNLNEITGGLKPGNLFVIASRPGGGKTTLLNSIISHLAAVKKLPGLALSGEQIAQKLTLQLVAGKAPFGMSYMINQGYTPTKSDLERFKASVIEFRTSGLFLENARGLSVEALRQRALQLKEAHGIRYITIDHIHLLRSDSERAKTSRKREFAEVVGGLKSLALELDIPVIALASLKPKAESRDVPRLSDLRGAVALESEADVIGFIHPPPGGPTRGEPDKDRQLEISIVKNRTGPTGTQLLKHITYCEVMQEEPTEDEKAALLWKDVRCCEGDCKYDCQNNGEEVCEDDDQEVTQP